MKFNTKSPLVLLCLFFSITFFFSCSKDSDLMADYVALDPDVLIGKYVRSDTFQISIISNSEDDTFEISVNSGSGGTENSGSVGTTVNDTYQTSSSASIVLDVLANDTFKNKEEVVISEISQPDNGDVVINSDNTLTYTPFAVEGIEDTFTYTVEFVKEDGTVGKETGNVTVSINGAGKNTILSQVMFTDAQISLMVNRVNNGFSRPGTNGQDITKMVNEAAEFLASPSVDRFDFLPTSGLFTCYYDCDPLPTNGVDDNIFYAGYYAFILANRNDTGDLAYAKQLANAIATQTLTRSREAGLDFSNSTTYPTIVNETNPFFFISAWMEKTMNNWAMIKSMNLVDNLSDTEEAEIDAWFADAGDWVYRKLENYYSTAFGSNWRVAPISTAWSQLKPAVIAIGGVAHNSYTTDFAFHTVFANIPGHHALLLHTYGLLYQDQDALDLSKRWYEDYFKYHVFPDGTSYELQRGSGSDPSKGVDYWNATITQTAKIAHTHAVAVLNNNPIVSGESYSYFYDYTTSEGLSDFLPSHLGADTKGGVKGLKNYIISFGKYMGQTDEAMNLWGTYRQVNQSPSPNHVQEDTYAYFVAIAQANAYYNNSTLKNIYSGTGGYQSPKTRNESGRGSGAWSESYMGSFGTYLIAFPYLETEGHYTGNVSP